MYKNPKAIIDDGIITGNIQDGQIQPNAIDFPVDSLYKINKTPFYLSNDKSKRVNRSLTLMDITSSHDVGHIFQHLNPEIGRTRNSGWLLEPGCSYEGSSHIYVEVPEKMAAFLVVKSTLNKNGVFIISGLYDSGYKGHIGFTLHNPLGYSYIEEGSFVGQIVFVDSESVGLYAGSYNTEVGQHWSELTTLNMNDVVQLGSDDLPEDPAEVEVADEVVVAEVSTVDESETVDEVISETTDELVETTTTSPSKSKKAK